MQRDSAPKANPESFPSAVWPFAALAFSAVVYFPVTRNYFYLDDFLNLYRIANGPPIEYLLAPHGGHMLIVRNAVFWATDKLCGPNPTFFYCTSFATHILNVYLLFRLLRLFGIDVPLASLGTALWGASPFNEGTLGWYSAFGQILVVTISLAILMHIQLLIVRGRIPNARIEWLWTGLALLGAMSFGTGIVFGLLLPVVLLLLFPNHYSWRRPPLMRLVILIPVIYYGTHLLYMRMTEVDVIIRPPWGAMLANLIGLAGLSLNLACIGVSSLLLGYWFLPLASVAAVWYAIGTVFGVSVAVVVSRAPKTTQRWICACGIIILGCYGLIAVARAFIIRWSSLGSADYARWHYFTQLLLAVVLCLALTRAMTRLGKPLIGVLVGIWYAVAVVGYVSIAPNIDNHEDSRQLTQEALGRIRAAIHSAPASAPIVIPNGGFRPMMLVTRASFPGLAGVFVIFYPSNSTDGRRIFFVERDPAVIQSMSRGERTSTLFVTPGSG